MLRWGIIGSGFAARKFVLGLRQSEDSGATLVYSRNLDNARSFAKDFNLAEVESNFDIAIQSKKVDAFYIATPPTAHRAQAIACLAQSKPTLIEKPMAATQEDAEAIAAAAREHGIFCMEGMWTRFLPLANRLRHLVGEGAIGTPRSLSGSFGASNAPEDTDNQFRPDLGGGALLHRGVYTLAFALDLLGRADLAASVATIGATGVDEDCSVILRHQSGCLSTLRASLRAPLPNDLTIEGTHGLIRVSAPIFRPFRIQLTKTRPVGRVRRGNLRLEALREGSFAQALQQRLGGVRQGLRAGGSSTITAYYSGNGYHYEADEVARCVKNGLTESKAMPLDQSVWMAGLMERARRAWSAGADQASKGRT
jgi:predicted dehydrogenase